MGKVRVRFAPSPELFNMWVVPELLLYNYLFAKQNQGTFVLRIEDTDLARSTEENLSMVC